MKTYKTVLYRFNGKKRTLETGLTLEEAQAICKDPNTSSRTCQDVRKLRRYGNEPWFVGYTEE